MYTKQDEIVICSCGSKEHNIILSSYNWTEEDCGPDINDYYICVTKYNHRNIFRRIVVAFKYIFGINEENFYADILLDEEGFEKLDAFVKDYKDRKDIK